MAAILNSKKPDMVAILDAILDFEKGSRSIFGDFEHVILHTILDLY